MAKDLQVVSTDGEFVISASGDIPIKVEGLTALVQEVVTELLSDVNPVLARGSGLPTIIRESFTDEEQTTRSLIASAVASSRDNLLLNQRSRRAGQPDQRLADLVLNSVQFDGTTWHLTVTVTNASGESAVLTV